MRLSVVDPVSPSIERTKQTLFDPFDFGKWLRLGLCAFLMSLGQGGGGGSSGYHGGGGNGGGGSDFDPVFDWLRENLPLVILIAAGLFLLFLAFGLLLTWLSSRGHFMFLDGVVNDRGAVVAPWNEYRREANSFFLFRVCLGLFIFLVVIVVLALCGVVAWPAIQAREPGPSLFLAIGLGVLLLLPFALLMGFVGTLLDDFVKPIMYLRRVGVREAWGIFNDQMFSGRVGTFVLYFLFKIVLGMAVATIAFAATCLTCCIVAIPYVGTVILLPLFVFLQAYPLYFIQQFGPEWQFFRDKPQGWPAAQG
jgi:hypothetical protein